MGYVDMDHIHKFLGSHLSKTLLKFEDYFPSQSDPRLGKQWIRNPFTSTEETHSLSPVIDDKLLELSCDQGLHARFNEMRLFTF